MVIKDKKPGKLCLLPSPRVTQPATKELHSAAQQITFAWDAVGAKKVVRSQKRAPAPYRLPRSTRYHLELAKDPDFNYPVQTVKTREKSFLTAVLEPGTYYWRISSMNTDLLEGPFSETGKIIVTRNLQVSAKPGREPVPYNGRDRVIYNAC